MPLINLSGQLFPPGSPVLPASNRGFRYGDGLFESIRYDGYEFPLLEIHWQRLSEGMKALCMEPPKNWSAVFFKKEISRITEEGVAARVRMAVFRSGGGWYAPESDAPAFLIEVFPLAAHSEAIAQSGIIDKVRVSQGAYSSFKTSNSLPYVLAARIRRQNGWEEGLILNSEGRVADGCHSNFFAVLDGKIITPPIAEGAIAGVMRSAVFALAGHIEIRPVLPEELNRATEVWFSNAISGVRWVTEFAGKPLKNDAWQELFGSGKGLWKNIPKSIQWANQ
jgi:branched-chain amino acid aminotransferase